MDSRTGACAKITGERPLTSVLLQTQLVLYGKVARMPDGSMTRDSTFCPGTLRPAVDRYIRKRGRPRLNWTTEVGNVALAAAGSIQQLAEKISTATAWRQCVNQYSLR